jgi:glutaconate CoA-transferase subunit B
MNCSATELLAVMAARQLAGVTSVFAGVGVPLVAAVLAQKTHAPHLVIVVEGGSIGPQVKPGRLPYSTNEMRTACRAQMLPGITDTFLFAQRGFLDVGFVGGAQIDAHGNLNSSVIGSYARPTVRLPGSGGANDIISLCRSVMVVTMHEKRRFVGKVDFVTSPGFLAGGDARRRAGLLFGKVTRIVTNLGILGFDEKTKQLRLERIHPGVSIADINANTGFDLPLPAQVPTTEAPTHTELEILRSIDPEGTFLKEAR